MNSFLRRLTRHSAQLPLQEDLILVMRLLQSVYYPIDLFVGKLFVEIPKILNFRF